MRVAVVGLGKIGLPLAVQYASKALHVTGLDINASIVSQLRQGHNPLPRERDLEAAFDSALDGGSLEVSSDIEAGVRQSQVVVLIVPSMLNQEGGADLSAIDSAAERVGAGLQKGTLVVNETTVPVGTTRSRIGCALERMSGLRAGSDFHLAFSPERVGSGTILHDLNAYPKIVGGINEESAKRATEFYESALDTPVRVVRSAETAEFSKLAELIYRDVNVALANEFAQAAERAGVDILEVISAANSEPLSHIHQPGVGVGGHCVPVNPYFLINEQGPMPMAYLARQINDGMPNHATRLVEEALGGLVNRTVLVLGLAYRPNVKEAAYSPTIGLCASLTRDGARALVHDPLFSPEEVSSFGLTPTSLDPPPTVDAVILQCFHDEYKSFDPSVLPGCSVVLDGRNALDRAELERKGLHYVGIGR